MNVKRKRVATSKAVGRRWRGELVVGVGRTRGHLHTCSFVICLLFAYGWPPPRHLCPRMHEHVVCDENKKEQNKIPYATGERGRGESGNRLGFGTRTINIILRSEGGEVLCFVALGKCGCGLFWPFCLVRASKRRAGVDNRNAVQSDMQMNARKCKSSVKFGFNDNMWPGGEAIPGE